MLSMLEDVRRCGGDVGDEWFILDGRPNKIGRGRFVLHPEPTRDACYRRGLLARYYSLKFEWRFALTVAGAEALRVHRRRCRAVGAQIQRELVAALEDL